MHEGIFDVLPVVDLNGVVERGYDLDFHSGLDVDAVAAFAAFGSYSVECHNQFSFSCHSFAKASKSIKTYKYYQVHIDSYSKKRDAMFAHHVSWLPTASLQMNKHCVQRHSNQL